MLVSMPPLKFSPRKRYILLYWVFSPRCERHDYADGDITTIRARFCTAFISTARRRWFHFLLKMPSSYMTRYDGRLFEVLHELHIYISYLIFAALTFMRLFLCRHFDIIIMI